MKAMTALAVWSIIAGSLAGGPATAQVPQPSFATNRAAASKTAATPGPAKPLPSKQRPLPFYGKVGTVNKQAGTIKVGSRVFYVTGETRIYTTGKVPATLDVAVVGERVSGSYKKSEGGKLTAYTLYFGPKAAAP